MRAPSSSLDPPEQTSPLKKESNRVHSSSQKEIKVKDKELKGSSKPVVIQEYQQEAKQQYSQQSKNFVQNQMHNSFFMYLRSKDDNLILLTTGVLINILINKEIDLQLLHRVNMLPKSRLSEFLQICDQRKNREKSSNIVEKSVSISQYMKSSQFQQNKQEKSRKLSNFTFIKAQQSSVSPLEYRSYNSELVDLLVKLLVVDPPFRLVTTKSLISLITMLTFSDLEMPRKFLKDIHLTQILLAYQNSIRIIKKLFNEQDICYFLSQNLEQAWQDYTPINPQHDLRQALNSPYIIFYFYPEHQRYNFIPQQLKFQKRKNDKAKVANEHFLHLRYIRYILSSTILSPNQYSPSSRGESRSFDVGNKEWQTNRNHYRMMVDNLREYPTIQMDQEQDYDGEEEEQDEEDGEEQEKKQYSKQIDGEKIQKVKNLDISKWRQNGVYKVPQLDKEMLACYIKKQLKQNQQSYKVFMIRLVILDEEFFLLFEPDKAMKNSGKLLKKAKLLNIQLSIDKNDPKTLNICIKQKNKFSRVYQLLYFMFDQTPEYCKVELSFENSLHCVSCKKNLEVRKNHSKQYQMTLTLSILQKCESDIDNLMEGFRR